MKRQDKKDLKHKEATERNEAWAELSPQQQLKQLDYRFGKDVGAKKQRARLQKLVENN